MLERGLHGALYLERRAHANRVGHTHVLNANAFHQARDQLDLARGNVPFIRAADSARNSTPGVNTRRFCGSHHGGETLNALSNGAIDVALTESLACSCKHHNLVRLCRGSRLKALHVGRQH